MEEGELGTEDSGINESLHKIEPNVKLDIENEEECSANSEDNEMEEEFLYLLRINELEEAVELIKSKKVKNLNYRNQDGNTALHFVMANNLEEATYFLLKILRVNYNVRNNSGNSPLVWAVQNKALEAVRVLLLHDYEINVNFIKNNLKERSKYFEKDEIESYLNYNSNCLLKGTKGLEMDKFELSDDLIDYYNINDNFNPENKINILYKNSFGKSLLSEVFNSNNLELLQLILEHPISHSLDRSHPNNYSSYDTGNSYDDNCDDNEVNHCELNKKNKKNDKEECVIHNFNFTTPSSNSDDQKDDTSTSTLNRDDDVDCTVRINEVSVCNGDILNSKESELDRSGMMIWESSIICSFWLYDLLKRNEVYRMEPDHILNNELTSNNKQLLSNSDNEVGEDDLGSVIELGSGCGLVGISFYKFCQILGKKVKKVILSDLSKSTLDNLSYNIDNNSNNKDEDNSSRCKELEVMRLDWKNFNILDKFKVVIGSDLIYDSSLVAPLIDTINRLLEDRGVFLYCFKSQRNGSNEFITEMVKNNYLVELRQVPREYQRNPLIGKSKEYCLSFFPDLESDDYFLLKAVKSPNV